MSSTSETGHAKNVSNFENLISHCIGYGASYNPSKVSIQLPALGTLHTSAKAAIKNVTDTGTAFINVTNSRQITFGPLKPLATKIVNALAATDASAKLVLDAKTINRKVQGVRKGDKPTPAPDAPPADSKQISVSQQSFDSQLDNFQKLIALVSSEPSYKPNETELQVASLNTMAANMQAGNTAAINAITDLSNSRIDRNKTLYAEKTGLCDVAAEVKKYIKSLFGAASPQFKQVGGIKFIRPLKAK